MTTTIPHTTGIDVRKALLAHKVNPNRVDEKGLLALLHTMTERKTYLQIALIAKRRFMIR